MIAGRPPDYRDVVLPRRMGTRVYLAAGAPPCIRLGDDAARPTGRDYEAVHLETLAGVQPPDRWVLAAILCPGDTSEALVAWVERHGAAPERILVVAHPDTDLVAALTAWYDAGHPDPVLVEAGTFRELAAPLGRFVNDWIYVDAVGTGWPL